MEASTAITTEQIFKKISNNGIAVDVVGAAKKAGLLRAEEDDLRAELTGLTGFNSLKAQYPDKFGKKDTEFNPRSSKHINAWLLANDRKEVNSVQEAVIERVLPNELFNTIMKARRIRKFYSDLEVMRKHTSPDGMVHVKWTVAVTGRWYTGQPPIQTMAKVCREFLVPQPGNSFYVIDWSQQELRLLAHLSNDEHLLGMFSEGDDPHKSAFERVTGLPCDDDAKRDLGKTLNYALIYGLDATGLGQKLKIPNDQSQYLIDQYFAAFPTLAKWREIQKAKVRDLGFVETLSGRRIPVDWTGNEDQAARKALNYVTQGSAADQLTECLMRIAMDPNLLDFVKATIHDALLTEFPPDNGMDVLNHLERIRHHMEQPFHGVLTPVEIKGPADTWRKAMSDVEEEVL